MQSRSALWMAIGTCLAVASGPALAEKFELAQLQTNDLRLLYQDPQQTYLTPYIARSFLNALELEKRIFKWAPYEKVTFVLTDTSDYGNGRALVSPQNVIAAELSPSSHAFETMPSNERFHSLTSHELVSEWNRSLLGIVSKAWLLGESSAAMTFCGDTRARPLP